MMENKSPPTIEDFLLLTVSAIAILLMLTGII